MTCKEYFLKVFTMCCKTNFWTLRRKFKLLLEVCLIRSRAVLHSEQDILCIPTPHLYENTKNCTFSSLSTQQKSDTDQLQQWVSGLQPQSSNRTNYTTASKQNSNWPKECPRMTLFTSFLCFAPSAVRATERGGDWAGSRLSDLWVTVQPCGNTMPHFKGFIVLPNILFVLTLRLRADSTGKTPLLV